MNALLPAVLIRGTSRHGDLRAITQRLDELYGASVSTIVRRVGDYQTTGLFCAFMEDRFALEGDRILAPMMDLLGQLLLDPVTENGVFPEDFVRSEKKNLISPRSASADRFHTSSEYTGSGVSAGTFSWWNACSLQWQASAPILR